MNNKKLSRLIRKIINNKYNIKGERQKFVIKIIINISDILKIKYIINVITN